MARPKIGEITQQEMADKVGISLTALRNWKDEGIDITDLRAVQARAAQMASSKNQQESYNDAKLRKLKAEADLKEFDLEVQRGTYVSKESELAAGMKVGMAVRSMLLRMADDLTPLLVGLDAGGMKKTIAKFSREKLVELSQIDADRMPITVS